MKGTSILTQPRPSLRRKKNQDHYVEVGGVRVRYRQEGAHHTGVPLLMVHGYNGSCDYFYPHTAPALGAERHVLAVDLPGNGLSAKLPAHNLEGYVQFLADFLAALRIDKADILGHSMGGMLAIGTVVKYPERFRKLILIDSAGLPELVKRQWLAPIKMMTDSSLWQVSLYPTFIKIGMRARTGREGLRMIRTSSVRRDLHTLSLPTLIIWGSRDRVVPLEHGAFMAKHIPGARLAIVQGAGHMPFYERPAECTRLVLSFLRAED